MMKAMIQDAYAKPELLHVEEVEKPKPADNEVLIRVHASSINQGDWFLYMGTPWMLRLSEGLFRPNLKTPGQDMAGVIEAIGKDVKNFKVGDEVYGEVRSSWAEYTCATEDKIALKAPSISFEEAGCIPIAARTALQGLRDHGKIKAGQKVIVVGASGGVGHYAVQIAKAFDTEVTAVCSTKHVEMVKSIGADHVIDYTKEDWTDTDKRYDLIFDLAGVGSFGKVSRMVTPEGLYVASAGRLSWVFKMAISSIFRKQVVGPWIQQLESKDLVFLNELIEEGKLKPVIEQKYKLEELGDALTKHGEGHAHGKKAIVID